jgi:hypothetical protein
MDGNFIISSHQVDFGKDGTTEKLVGVVDMTDGEAVGDGPGVQRSNRRRDANRCPSWA